MTDQRLNINEMFETIQGEGVYTGVPAVFVRLQGCPVGCPWCDTKHTWELNENMIDSVDAVINKAADSERYFGISELGLLALFEQQRYQAKHVVLTGGEPCMYDLTELTELLHEHGYTTQIETSGAFEVRCAKDTWVTVSPKINMKGGYDILTSALERANEIKHPIAMQKHIDELDALLSRLDAVPGIICLQPISQQPRATELAIKTCIERNWRLSLQTHKYVGIA